jgi:hypothetical protein
MIGDALSQEAESLISDQARQDKMKKKYMKKRRR